MTTIIETIVFLVNDALSNFLNKLNIPQNAKIISKANTGSTSKISALMKKVGVPPLTPLTPALSKKQSRENAASAD